MLSENYTTPTAITTTEAPYVPDDAKYLIAPLVVMVLVMILSILVYLMARRRRMISLRRNILSLYDFDSHEQEWESLTNSNEYPTYTNDHVTTRL
ncbi:unnamed protein product [Acanthoscelides obtectus]|uniref:Uncharacterized protein n=1 Tax=Acanthoscelides obtectus TaxID=200917 RepID=A0A9P0P944_ACAOB|nr:unnamed protein product [Acanthoscelides obtectus]CAK1662302.1 hypothetical protein AOBTE_LOCUS23076 [Acanthoscelides obtectus]